MRTKLQLKRIYEQSSEADGKRFFIERLWPRGISKAALADAQWLKDVAPSTELREWFGHDLERWDEFRRRYFIELKKHHENLSPILEAAREGAITLLYSSHDREHNNAVALREFLQHELVPWDPAPCLCLK